MAGKSPAQALEAFLTPLQRAASCLTREQLVVSYDPRKPGKRHGLLLADGRVAVLRRAPRLGLTAAIWYELVRWEDDAERGPWKSSTLAYRYELLGPDDAEILVYHWHPENVGPDWPHLHIGTSVLQAEAAIDRRKHVPTGRVAFEDVLALALELGAEPLRDDAREILEETRKRFVDWRTWG